MIRLVTNLYRKARITFVVVIISEAISVFGLAALLVWLTYEKVSFHRQWRNQLPVLEAPQYISSDEKVLPQHNADVARSLTSLEVVQLTAVSPSSTSVPSGRASEGKAYLPRLSHKQKERAMNNWSRLLDKIRVMLKISREARRQELQESEEMNILDPNLRKLAILHELPSTDINDIQFDPSGTFLAICSDVLWIRFGIQVSAMN